MIHVFLETEKAHHLPLSVGWRPREASGVTQSATDGQRPRGADVARLEFKGHSSTRSSGVRGQEKKGVQIKERENLPFLPLFVPFGPQWIRWCPPTLMHSTNLNANLAQKRAVRHSLT